MFRFPNPTPILPNLHGFNVKKKPVTAASSHIHVNGRETTILTQAFPLWEFELTHEALRTETENSDLYTQYNGLQEYESIASVFIACRGQYGRFFFRDPSDYSRQGQYIGDGDGVLTRFRLVRTISSGTLAYTEPVGGIDLTTVPTVKVRNVVQASGWSIESDLQTIQFTSPPSGQITIDFAYFYYCRFLEDLNDFEEFMHNLHSLQSLKFRSSKDCDVSAPNPYFLGYYT